MTPYGKEVRTLLVAYCSLGFIFDLTVINSVVTEFLPYGQWYLEYNTGLDAVRGIRDADPIEFQIPYTD